MLIKNVTIQTLHIHACYKGRLIVSCLFSYISRSVNRQSAAIQKGTSPDGLEGRASASGQGDPGSSLG